MESTDGKLCAVWGEGDGSTSLINSQLILSYFRALFRKRSMKNIMMVINEGGRLDNLDLDSLA